MWPPLRCRRSVLATPTTKWTVKPSWSIARARRAGPWTTAAATTWRGGRRGWARWTRPARYVGDGLGDFSHVGLYVGENVLADVDKNGNARSCDVVHSSATMGRVAGSTLANGWTHVMWFSEIDYGENVGTGVEAGTEISQGATNATTGPEEGLTAGTPVMDAARYAVVVSPDGGPVKLRKSASAEETLYWLVNAGARVLVERERDGWALIRAICTDGYTRRAYMMARYLEEENERG